MVKQNLFSRLSSWLPGAVLAFAAALAFMPNALAAPTLNYTEKIPELFKVYEGGDYAMNIELTEFADDTTVEVFIEGPVDDPESSKYKIGEFEYTQDGVHEFTWDGTVDGDYLLPGDYLVTVSGEDLQNNPLGPLDGSFEMTEETNMTVITPQPDDVPADFASFEYELETAVGACIVFEVDGAVEKTEGPLSSGTYSFNWGSPGEYEWSFIADPQYCDGDAPASTEELASGKLVVLDGEDEIIQAPTLGFTEMLEATYVLDSGNYSVEVGLENFDSNTTVEMTLTGPKEGNEQSFVADTYLYQDNGTHTFLWNGEDEKGLPEPGEYTVTFQGMYGQDQMTNKLEYVLSVEEKTVEPPVEEEFCGGFTDLPGDYVYCDAVKKVKAAGLMTGQDDGTGAFDIGPLNRAEAVQIYARLDANYDEVNEVCEVIFPDVVCDIWYGPLVYYSHEQGYVTGYEAPDPKAGMFGPGDDQIQPQGFVLLSRVLDVDYPHQQASFGGKISGSEWYSGAYAWAEMLELLPADEIDLNSSFTREDMARVLAKLIDMNLIQ